MPRDNIESRLSGPSREAMVVSSHPLATNAGLRVLREGGNAVDAAVATALALGVVSLAFSGLGGGGFMLIFDSKSGKSSVVDYRETAPIRSKPNMFQDPSTENSIGYKAIATPSTLLGLSFALERFGTKSFGDVCEDAETYARQGFVVNKFLSRALHENSSMQKFTRFRESSGIMLRKDGKVPSEGDQLSFPKLGNLIESAKSKVREFYHADFARTISEFVSEKGGIISEEDFRKYEPKLRDPIIERVGNYSVASLPPPSSGGICIVQLLKMIQGRDIKKRESAETIAVIASSLEKVYDDRKGTIADPDFVNVDSKKLVSESYIQNMSRGAGGTLTSHHNSQTTHLSVIDFEGNAVSMTESLECYFGSGVFVPEFDMFLNDTMHDFDRDPRSINAVAPLKRPRSSMSPTILFKDETPFLILGSAGGPRIISSTFQVILNVIKFGMDIERAVHFPRVHYEGIASGGKDLYLENGIANDETMLQLKSKGYNLQLDKPDYFFGGVNAIHISDGKISGAADQKRNGLAATA